MPRFLLHLRRLASSVGAARRGSRPAPTARPTLEALEGRRVVVVLVRYEIEQPVYGFLTASQRNGREHGVTEPGIAGGGEGGSQQLECFEGVGLGDRHDSLGGRIIFARKEPTKASRKDCVRAKNNVSTAVVISFGITGRDPFK